MTNCTALPHEHRPRSGRRCWTILQIILNVSLTEKLLLRVLDGENITVLCTRTPLFIECAYKCLAALPLLQEGYLGTGITIRLP